MANQKLIADALNITQATVSRALRGDVRISAELRRRVLEKSKELGYRINPMVAALMKQVQSGKHPHHQGSIGILVDYPSKEPWLESESTRHFLKGFQQRAKHHGYNLEYFFLQSEEYAGKSIDRILYSRGISAVILAPKMRRDQLPMRLTWERYAIAAASYEWNLLQVNRVSADHRYNVDLAFSELQSRGYERIGLCLPFGAHHPIFCKWLSAYLGAAFFTPKRSQIPVLITKEPQAFDQFAKWYDRWRPDAVLTLAGNEQSWLAKLGLSKNDLGLVCLAHPQRSKCAGIEEDNDLAGEMIVDVVVNGLIHNERGLPKDPQLILMQGHWVDGASLPARKR